MGAPPSRVKSKIKMKVLTDIVLPFRLRSSRKLAYNVGHVASFEFAEVREFALAPVEVGASCGVDWAPEGLKHFWVAHNRPTKGLKFCNSVLGGAVSIAFDDLPGFVILAGGGECFRAGQAFGCI
jgi:hypothetical protein